MELINIYQLALIFKTIKCSKDLFKAMRNLRILWLHCKEEWRIFRPSIWVGLSFYKYLNSYFLLEMANYYRDELKKRKYKDTIDPNTGAELL